ncbi:MAG TPA: AlkA N-terminal domain-containing protein [Steroidobacteraceae bacterium]|nr:AlkA N-terminal domain-containing protein [Steroidobacteraceae bacterium]
MRTAVAEIPVVEPFPWRTLVGYFSYRLIPQLERVEPERFYRRVGRREIAVEYDAARTRLIVTADGRVKSAEIVTRVSQLFAVDHDANILPASFNDDSSLAPRIAAVPGMRPLGTWSPFELCARTVIGQQVTVAAAGTLMRRLVERCGEITPSCVLSADLSNMGMPGRRVETIRGLARAVLDERVDFDLPWKSVEAALKTLPGFGPWTRAYLGIRLGREPDAFPETDLGLIRAAGVSSPADLLKRAEAWRPWRAFAATYLWAVTPT